MEVSYGDRSTLVCRGGRSELGRKTPSSKHPGYKKLKVSKAQNYQPHVLSDKRKRSTVSSSTQLTLFTYQINTSSSLLSDPVPRYDTFPYRLASVISDQNYLPTHY